MKWFTQNNIISWFLAFVVAWFGFNEILKPTDWVVFAPSFISNSSFATNLVIIHGIILIICALLLVFNYYRLIASYILVVIFSEIILELILASGLSDVAVRDIGLLGMALANTIE